MLWNVSDRFDGFDGFPSCFKNSGKRFNLVASLYESFILKIIEIIEIKRSLSNLIT